MGLEKVMERYGSPQDEAVRDGMAKDWYKPRTWPSELLA